jgi:hypothetical protein
MGFRPPDERWRKMKAVWDACKDAGTEPPESVGKFFDWGEPDERGVEVSQPDLEKVGAVKKYMGKTGEGLEVEIAKLPENVAHVRFWIAR